MTHRRRVSCRAKPPRPPASSSRSLQCQSTELALDGSPASGHGASAMARQNSPNTPLSQHFPYKTRPARPKWPFLAGFARAGRTLYRMTSGSGASQPISATCAAGAEGAGERGGCEMRGLTAVPAGDDDTTASQISHAIRLKEVSIMSENVAIPTLLIHGSKESRGNCMRNWESSAMTWILINTTRPTGVEGVGGHGRASKHRA